MNVLPALAFSWLTAFNCRAPLLTLGPLLPLIIADLHLSATVAGSLSGLPLLLMGAVAIPAGVLGDRLGPRRLLAASQLAMALGGGLRGLASNEMVLLAASVALGAGIGLSQPALVQVARAISQRHAGMATAVYANGLFLGAVGGVILTTPVLLPLAGASSWRGVFLIWAAVALVSSLGWLLVPAPGHTRAAAARPMPLREVLAIPGLAPRAIALAVQAAIFYAATTWWPQYYVSLGWSLADASLALSLLTTGSIAGTAGPAIALWWGGARRLLVAGAAVALVAVVGLAVAPQAAHLWALAIGVGTSFAFSLGLAAPAELAPRGQVGAVAGVVLALTYACSLLGPLGFGALRDLTGGFGASLAYLVGLTVVLLAASAAVPNVKREA